MPGREKQLAENVGAEKSGVEAPEFLVIFRARVSVGKSERRAVDRDSLLVFRTVLGIS